MQRTSEDLEDRLDVGDRVDVTELIARIAAERNDEAVEPPHRGDDEYGYYSAYGYDDAPVDGTYGGYDAEYRAPDDRDHVDHRNDGGPRTGVTELIARLAAERGESRPTSSVRPVDDRTDVSELITRIAAERGDPFEDTAAHRLALIADARRSRRRRLAPVAAGIATVLVAGTIALTLRAHQDDPAGPELNAALVGSSAPNSVAPPEPAPAIAAPPAEDTVPGADALAAPAIARAKKGVLGPTAAAKPATPVVGDGTQAATAQHWKLIDRDEFNGALSPRWSRYDGEGNAGEGRRSPDAISVRNGSAVIHGDADGTTGGMSWKDDRETGRWEMRAKFPKGDAQYHPVLLLWPDDGGSGDGEIDFAETTSASDSVSFFLHHGDDQESAKKKIDLTQWHNYAVEVTSDRVTGYIDGQKWFESTDRDTLPSGPVHPVIQLDWFPKGDSPAPTDLLVDWLRIYE
jgi:Glycosyl hydrolases family 16